MTDALKKKIVKWFWFLLVTPFAALILSLVGLVISKKLQARFAGCVFCLVLSILELCFVAYMSKPVSVPPAYTIQPHSLSPEESASIESVNEEINRALYGDNITKTSK
jgi:ABC-type transport system involved in cytochrome c biogenesis permease subunit